MNDKKGKFNFTPKTNALKSNYKRNNLIFEEELKRKIYQNDLEKKEQNKFNQKHNKSIDNNYLTEIHANTNDNMINSDSNNISQILTEYLEEIQQSKSKENRLNKESIEQELKGNKNIKNKKGLKNNINDKGKYANFKSSNNSSEMDYLITTNEKENIDFISTLLKLKGIRSIKTDRNDKKSAKNYLYENNNFNLNNKARKGSNNEATNQKKSFNVNVRNNKFIKLSQIKTGKEKSSGDLDKNIEEYTPTKNIKKSKKRNDKINNKSYINKTISSKNRNDIREVTINLIEPEIRNTNTNRIREKSFDNKTYRKTSPIIRDNNKKITYKTKSANRSPITNLLKNKDINKSNKNNKLNITNDKDAQDKEKSKSKIRKKNANLEKNEKNNKTRKKSEDDKKKKVKTKSRKKDKSKEKQEKEKDINQKGKHPKMFSNKNYIYKNNYRNYDSRKLKRVQNQKFSVIDEIDEETKGETMKSKKTNNKKESESNDNTTNENKAPQMIKKANEIYLNNNNRYGFKNTNISMISSETFSNDIGMGFSDKKNLLASFFSTSTFNNDIVNYKPSEKNSSYALNNAQSNNNNDGDGNNINLINNLNATNFSIINNSNININNDNPNNNSLLTQTNINASKNNDKLVGSLSGVIRLNPENDEKINFQIENNTNIINEIDSNDLSDIIPLENKDITIDYKINVYDSSKLKNDLKIKNSKNIGNNNASKEISSNDEEGESIVNQFDIINNQRQNESKEIKFSQIKSKDLLTDNNNISNSNGNISLVNLSKFTNFADSNIKLGDISQFSNRISGRNEMKKTSTNKNMEIIQEMEQNSNNNTNKNPEKSDIKKDKIDVNDMVNDTSDNCNISDDSDTIENILNDSKENIKDKDSKDNEKYFCINKNIENNNNNNNEKTSNSNKDREIKENIKETKNKIKIEKEPKDSVRNNEPKDNYRKKNINYIYVNKEFKDKFCETKTSNKSNLKNNIFEYDDLNPANRLVKTNRKDIIKIDKNKDNLITTNYNNIMKITLKESLSNGLLYGKKMSCSPPPTRPNDKLEFINLNSNIENNKNRIIAQFNNIKKISKNKSINEPKGKTLKNINVNYLDNIENRNNPQKSSIIYSNYSPPSTKIHNAKFDFPLHLNTVNKGNEPEVNNFMINHTQSHKAANNIENYRKNENIKGNEKLFVNNNNNQILYNGASLKNDINKIQNPIQYYPNNQLNPQNMNVYNNIKNFNDNYNINPSYKNYVQ